MIQHLNVAETPDSSTTAEPIPDKEPTLVKILQEYQS